MPDPKSITTPSDLTTPISFSSTGNLRITRSIPLSLGITWIREAVAGLAGDIGCKLETGLNAIVNLALDSQLAATVSLDTNGWLRLQFFKSKSCGLGLGVNAAAGVQAVGNPENFDSLLAYLLGSPQDAALCKSLNAAFQSFEAFSALAPAIKRPLRDTLGRIASQSEFDKAKSTLESLFALRDSIYNKSLAALGKKYEAELSWQFQAAVEETALYDCSFAFTPPGLDAYRKALAGDLCLEPGEHVRLRQCVLTSALHEQSTVELHLPFFTAKQWTSRLDALARAEITVDGTGRLIVYTVEASDQIAAKNSYQSILMFAGVISNGCPCPYTLTYSDRRTVRPAALNPVLKAYGFADEVAPSLAGYAEVDASLTLSIPGTLAEAWFHAPLEREPEYIETFRRVSVAVQSAMRNWLPFVYFSSLDRYDDIATAYPLLIYRCSHPCVGKGRTQFAYDVMDRQSAGRACRFALADLERELETARHWLTEAGKKDTAEFYDPELARRIRADVRRGSLLMNSLLYSDAIFVEELIKLGVRARRFQTESASAPAQAAKDLARFAASVVKTFHGRLKRLYGGREFLSFGSLLLIEATNALRAAPKPDETIQAVLEVNAGGQNLKWFSRRN